MFRVRRHPLTRRRQRAGLAPLELVLSLPLMLFVLVLMINFGDVARWKVRAQQNARYAGWRTLSGRTGNFDPNPHSWRLPATLNSGQAQQITKVNEVWDSVEVLNNEVVRGPQNLIKDPLTGSFLNVEQKFQMSEDVHYGNARIKRPLHLLRRLIPKGWVFNLHQNLLENPWQFHHIGYLSNLDRRARLLYRLEPDQLPGFDMSLQARLTQAHQAMASNPLAANLDPLDRDAEFIRYRGSPPEFHPRVIGCSADLTIVEIQLIEPLIRRINRLPGTMARALINLYQREINRLQAMNPPLVQLIRQLQQKIDQLNSFLRAVPPQNQ